MTNTEKLAALLALHSPEAINGTMVGQVWEDGEYTLQKGGDLYGMRSLHCIKPGIESCAIPGDGFPIRAGSHGSIFVSSDADMKEARRIILGDSLPQYG